MKPTLNHRLYTADQVAELLSLHVKTIRRYVQEGRLKAKRIGKEYRITRADLGAFAGDALPSDAPVVETARHVIVSSVLDASAVRPEDAQRVTRMVMASLNSRRGEGDFPRVDTIYYD